MPSKQQGNLWAFILYIATYFRPPPTGCFVGRRAAHWERWGAHLFSFTPLGKEQRLDWM